MTYEHLIAEFLRTPWALLPEKIQALRLVLARKMSGETIPDEEIAALKGQSKSNVSQQRGRVAVLPIVGTLVHRGSGIEESSGVPSILSIGKKFDALMNDPGIKAIVLDIESPGGSVYGTKELGDKIYQARNDKKIVAIANALAASAAYWILCQASEAWMKPTGHVGSIGVFMAYCDDSKMMADAGIEMTLISSGKYKTEGAYGPLSEEAKSYFQSECDRYYGMFLDAVARGRGKTTATVQEKFGQGRVVGATEALKAGMVDKVGTLEDVLQSLGISLESQASPARLQTPHKRLAAQIDLANLE